jgi:hypothetical protein
MDDHRGNLHIVTIGHLRLIRRDGHTTGAESPPAQVGGLPLTSRGCGFVARTGRNARSQAVAMLAIARLRSNHLTMASACSRVVFFMQTIGVFTISRNLPRR